MKYIIKCDIEKEIEAIDEDEAMEMFYDELAEENDCLENHTTIEDYKKEKEHILWTQGNIKLVLTETELTKAILKGKGL